MAAPTVKTRILIISDTHCAALKDESEKAQRPLSLPLPSADLLIHCGDLTYTGKMDEYHRTLDMIKEIDAPVKLVIAGNHDLTLDRDFIFSHLKWRGVTEEQAEAQVKEARDLWTAPDGRAKSESITFLDEGLHHIDLPNGAKACVYASPYTPEFCDWGFPYERDEDRWNTPGTSLSDAKNIAPYPVPSFETAEPPVDVLITHGPPWAFLDQTTRGDFAGCPHLLRAVMRARPLVHCFGHIHEGWGAKVVKWSHSADEIVVDDTSVGKWKNRSWKAGVDERSLEDVEVDSSKAKQRHAALLDLSSGGRTLKRGRETAFVNASIMNVSYSPENAPWLLDVELPRTG